jgi:hypothetical protein
VNLNLPSESYNQLYCKDKDIFVLMVFLDGMQICFTAVVNYRIYSSPSVPLTCKNYRYSVFIAHMNMF